MAKAASSKGNGAPGQPQSGHQAVVAQRFVFEGTGEVRTVLIDGEPWFVGKDVCERLGYANPSKAMTDHCKGITKRYPLRTHGGTQPFRILAQPDVMRLIVGSTLPAAQRFEQWVFEEVLPSIRRTGGYMVAGPDETPEALVLRAMNVLQDTVVRQKAQIGKLQGAVAEAAPKILAWERLMDAEGLITVSNAARAMGVQQTALFAFLEHNIGWCFRNQIKGGPGPLTAKVGPRERGYLETKLTEFKKSGGRTGSRPQVYLTAKGVRRLTELAIQRGLIKPPETAKGDGG